jgi:hypothetical protein
MNEAQLVRLLEVKFGSLDFWWLSKDWKQRHYQQVARLIISAFESEGLTDSDTQGLCRRCGKEDNYVSGLCWYCVEE